MLSAFLNINILAWTSYHLCFGALGVRSGNHSWTCPHVLAWLMGKDECYRLSLAEQFWRAIFFLDYGMLRNSVGLVRDIYEAHALDCIQGLTQIVWTLVPRNSVGLVRDISEAHALDCIQGLTQIAGTLVCRTVSSKTDVCQIAITISATFMHSNFLMCPWLTSLPLLPVITLGAESADRHWFQWLYV